MNDVVYLVVVRDTEQNEIEIRTRYREGQVMEQVADLAAGNEPEMELEKILQVDTGMGIIRKMEPYLENMRLKLRIIGEGRISYDK